MVSQYLHLTCSPHLSYHTHTLLLTSCCLQVYVYPTCCDVCVCVCTRVCRTSKLRMFAQELNLARCCVFVYVTCVDTTPAHRQTDRSNRLVLHFVTVQAFLNPVPFFVCVRERGSGEEVRHVLLLLLMLWCLLEVLTKHLLTFEPSLFWEWLCNLDFLVYKDHYI